ncbi:MAG: fumarate hydratase C-terminal domain-containing protein [Actinobacteria bacterium]|nr:fumarate hydratase C-terminal domain-containing protein [Actinomycetota bacterium]
MLEPMTVKLPLQPDVLASLRAGQQVLLSGSVFTARDVAHARLAERLAQTPGHLPFGLAGQALLYAGPTPPSPGRPAGSIGPTTASRMDEFTPGLFAAGITAAIGKGPRSPGVRDACAKFGAVYFAAVGGAAALLGTKVVSATPVAYEDLGTEAIVRLELVDFPAVVAIDSLGGDLYASAVADWATEVGEVSS